MAGTTVNLTHTTARRSYRGHRATVAALVAATALTGCATNNQDRTGSAAVIIGRSDEDAYHGTLVDPPLRVAAVTLRDTDGNTVRLDRLPDNKATAVFFGFTHCPDICPTTMADLASAQQSLPPNLAERVALYFVTVDPKRDTSKVLRTWLDHFDPNIIGLRGATALVNEAERSLYAVESKTSQDTADDNAEDGNLESDHHNDEREDRPGEQPEPHSHPGGDEEVSHSGSVYVFGPEGETVLYTGGYTADQYAADLARLLRDPPDNP